MNHLFRNALAIVTVLSALSGCGRDGQLPLPTAPTAAPPLVRPGASPTAIPASLGQPITGVVNLSDPTCESAYRGEPGEPCQRFAIAIPTSGVLTVQLTTPGPYSMTLGIGTLRQWATAISASVEAGSTYEISVSLHDAPSGTTGQSFQLTTSLAPR